MDEPDQAEPKTQLASATTPSASAPASFRLYDDGSAQMAALLVDAGLPKTAVGSVKIALAAVLGDKPEEREYRYEKPYPQLPTIVAKARPDVAVAEEVEAELHVTHAQLSRPLLLRGRYRRIGYLHWRVVSQRIDSTATVDDPKVR